MKRQLSDAVVVSAIGFVVGAVIVESMIGLVMQRTAGEGVAFSVMAFILMFCSALIGVLFSVVCVDASLHKLGLGTVIGCIYGLLAPFVGEHLTLLILQLAMRIAPLLLVVASMLLIMTGFAPSTRGPLSGIAVLLVVGLLVAAMFGHVANADGGGPGATVYAQVLIIYSGGFALGTALQVML